MSRGGRDRDRWCDWGVSRRRMDGARSEAALPGWRVGACVCGRMSVERLPFLALWMNINTMETGK